MIFKKTRKLTHGKELIRTDKFTLIYLGNGNIHYSYAGKNQLIYGDIDLKRNRFRILPLVIISTVTTLFLGFGPMPAFAYTFFKGDIQVSKEVKEFDKTDMEAKKASDSYLDETERQKKALLTSSSAAEKNSDSEIKKWKLSEYKVKDNETLSEISEKFGISKDLIASSSNINVTDKLQNGQTLNIPNKRGLVYSLKKGDTLAKIANYYKVSINDIMEENEVSELDLLNIGDKIFLPGAIVPQPPVIWHKPVPSGTVTSGYGWRSYPRYKFHDAIDLKANYEPVKAARSGKVIYSGWMGGYGNVVILEHSNGYKTLYAHNSKLYVKNGDYIQGGKLITRSGCSGYCFGAHLHFEVIKDGKTLNPLKFLKGLRHK